MASTRIAAPAQALPTDEAVAASAVGMDGRALRQIVERFRAQQSSGAFPGGQIVIRRRGRVVVDESVGVARGFRLDEGTSPVAVTPDTRFLVFSACKPVIALAIAVLEDRGLLDVDAPIASVWPGFRRHGKERITTVDVLTHRGGILMPDFVRRHLDWADWDKVVTAVEDTRPTYRRGQLAYHPFEYGWVLAEVVQRVSGRSFPDFLRTEIAEPAGLPGLRFGATQDELDGIARNYWLGSRSVYVADVNVAALFEEVNNAPHMLTAFVPGAGLVTNARTLAAFYQLLVEGGVAASGRRILSAGTLARYTRRNTIGFDRSTSVVQAVGRGFLLGTLPPSLYGYWDTGACFGHAGAFCTVAFADARTGLCAAMVTNANRGPADLVRRFLPLNDSIRRACRD